jgi:hypothetical protein
VFVHKSIELSPRNQFEQVMEDAILVPHGVGSCSCPDDSKPSGTEKNQCRALVQAQNVPDSRAFVAGIHVLKRFERQKREWPGQAVDEPGHADVERKF